MSGKRSVSQETHSMLKPRSASAMGGAWKRRFPAPRGSDRGGRGWGGPCGLKRHLFATCPRPCGGARTNRGRGVALANRLAGFGGLGGRGAGGLLPCPKVRSAEQRETCAEKEEKRPGYAAGCGEKQQQPKAQDTLVLTHQPVLSHGRQHKRWGRGGQTGTPTPTQTYVVCRYRSRPCARTWRQEGREDGQTLTQDRRLLHRAWGTRKPRDSGKTLHTGLSNTHTETARPIEAPSLQNTHPTPDWHPPTLPLQCEIPYFLVLGFCLTRRTNYISTAILGALQ